MIIPLDGASAADAPAHLLRLTANHRLFWDQIALLPSVLSVVLPDEGTGGIGFDSADRAAGVGLILCGALFAVMALLVRSGRDRSPEPPAGT